MRLKPSFPRRHPNTGEAAIPESLWFDGIRLPLAAYQVMRPPPDPASRTPSHRWVMRRAVRLGPALLTSPWQVGVKPVDKSV